MSFPQAIIWGLMASAAGFATSIVSERTAGTFLRLRMAPLHPVQILAGKSLACFLTALTVGLVLTAVAVIGFHVRITNLPGYVLALGTSSFCIVGLMMFISTLGHTERAVGGAGWAVMIVMAMFGGGMVPLYVMPGWMKAASDFSPIKWSIYAFEGSLWRTLPLRDLFLPCALLLGVGLLLMAAGLLNFYRLMKR